MCVRACVRMCVCVRLSLCAYVRVCMFCPVMPTHWLYPLGCGVPDIANTKIKGKQMLISYATIIWFLFLHIP